jgi:alanyl-tRNA synthetase
MAGQKAAARAAWKGSGAAASEDIWFDIAERHGSTEFTGYAATDGEGEVVAIVRDGVAVDSATAGDMVTLLTNQTPFYGDSGGQMGDIGTIASTGGLAARVTATAKPLGRLHAHSAEISAGSVKIGDVIQLHVDADNRDRLRANHSATHLVHAALRNRLGAHVTQKGSQVAADRFRFDFSHPTALSSDDIAAVEAEVNAQIRGNDPVTTRLMTPDDAIAAGALALFGEKYGDEVRVLSMGHGNAGGAHYSVELCGGTHVRALGDIALFKIISEGAVASGIRRIEALTGEAARDYLVQRDEAVRSIAATLRANPDEVPSRVAAMADQLRQLERELADARKKLAMGGGGAGGPAVEAVNGLSFMAHVVDGLDPKELRGAVDDMKRPLTNGVVMLVAVNDGRASVAIGVTEDAAERANAVALIQIAVAALGGQGGGGRPLIAQGGGPDGNAAQTAVDAVRAALAA